ncbi:hypothetical protein JCM8202_001810 [Rhodotorula sphaerocarpa]
MSGIANKVKDAFSPKKNSEGSEAAGGYEPRYGPSAGDEYGSTENRREDTFSATDPGTFDSNAAAQDETFGSSAGGGKHPADGDGQNDFSGAGNQGGLGGNTSGYSGQSGTLSGGAQQGQFGGAK